MPAPDPLALVVGEALVDVLGPHGRDRVPGGSPLNVAVGLSRLGVTTTLVTELAADADGERIRAHARASGVTVRADDARRTSTATVLLDADGVAGYTFDVAWSLAPDPDRDAADLDKVGLFHCGSIAAYLAPGAAGVDVLLEEAVARGAFTSFDPNIRAPFVGDPDAAWRRTQAVAARCDLVKLSDEDASFLASALGVPGDPVEAVARALLRGRTQLVVVTAGPRGCVVADRDGVRRFPGGPPVEVADTVGAGDSFMAALLAHVAGRLRRGASALPQPGNFTELEDLVAYADAAARVTVTRAGADPPWHHEL
ncbi:fructokinase [Nocardioides massiliensis]|uniref:Fructokinase n=3 Tax=Nocardioides massiliensis TaxID=1325935 RepID=A0ABT9NJK2_9ACTN|nr:carbohydrate kinase [Nocardioides massiliensis]MDP9820587.1 fructokinase [Nocardioides massiliensis]